MAAVDSLDTLLISELRQVYDTEQRLTKAIPKLVEASSNSDLVNALSKHLNETRQHVARLEEAFGVLEAEAEAKTCVSSKGLISDADDRAGECERGSLRDAAIIGATQCIEHYEIAAYGTVIAHARLLGRNPVVRLLEATLSEEKAASQALTDIAERVVNPNVRAGVSEVRPRTTA